MRRNIRRDRSAAFVLAAVACATSAHAQTESTSADASTEDIVVTAQRRAQSLNDVGLSITAVSSDVIETMGIRDTADLAKLTPGLTYTPSFNGTPLFTLRGVGFNDYTLGSSPAVSVYVDEVPLPYSVMTRGAALDLERVEVLKGPQGLLYGQNSTGGAINYIAAKPGASFDAGMDLTYGRFDQFDGTAYAGGPLTDTLGVRVAMGVTASGDWQNSFTRDDSIGSKDIVRGRAQLHWEPSSAITIRAMLSGWSDRSDSPAAQFVGLQLQRTAGSGATAAEVNRRIAALRATPVAPNDPRAADWGAMDYARKDDFIQGSVRADVNLSDHFTLTSLSALSRYDEDYLVDRDGTTLQVADVGSEGKIDSFVQELRLQFDFNSLTGTLGASYSRNKIDNTVSVWVKDATTTILIPTAPINTGHTRTTQDIREYSFFANAEWELVDRLTLLAGARYTNNRNDFTGCSYGDPATTLTIYSTMLSGSPTAPIGPTQCYSLKADFKPSLDPVALRLDQDNVSWRVGLNFKPDAGSLIYANAARGYKSGSFPNLSASAASQFSPVQQESVTAYELGFRAGMPGGMGRLSGALFQYQYKDKQIRSKVVDRIFNLLEALVNVPKSRIRGVELEYAVQPARGLSLALAGTYVDSKVQRFSGINETGLSANFAGSTLPYSPTWQLSGRADYEWSLTDRMDAFVGASFAHNSRANGALGEPAITTIKPFTTVDAQAGVDFGQFRAWVWGKNITDRNYWTNAYNLLDIVARYTAQPATYGVTLSYKLGQ